MKNYEKYVDKIRKYEGDNFCIDFVLPNILESNDCDGKCDKCRMFQMIWLFEEHKEPKVDWSKVEVDTPILVRNDEIDNWTKRYFAKYEHSEVFVWVGGRTSWNETNMLAWNYTKLAESEEE